jgi:E3 ubiquitin-protein ligase BRE1
LQDALKEVERLKMELSTLPEHVVVETTEHKCLQSQFSVLYNEAMQLKTQLEEARNQLQVIISKTIFRFMSILFYCFQF